MDYLDFDLRIAAGSDEGYPVAVVRSPEGEVSTTMQRPFDEPGLRSHLETLDRARGLGEHARSTGEPQRDAVHQHSVSEEPLQDVEQFGRELFDSLLSSEVRSLYRSSLARAREQGKGLRLRLRIEAPELANLPWEYLYDATEGDYLCLSGETPLIRYIELARPPQSLAVEPPLRILGMVASSHDQQALDVRREQEDMAAAIDHLLEAGTVALTWLDGQTWRDLQRAMRQGPWHVFHFIGHGSFDQHAGEGLVILADEDGGTFHLTATQLGRLLAGHSSMRLAVLNSCEGARASEVDLFSSTGSILTQRGIPAVVSMQHEITDRAALEFSRSFYDSPPRRASRR